MKKANHAFVLKEAESPSEEAEPPSRTLLEDHNSSALSLLFPELIQFPPKNSTRHSTRSAFVRCNS